MRNASNPTRTIRGIAAFALVCLAGAGLAMTAPQDDKSDNGAKGDPYPLDFCAVSGEKLGSMGDPIVIAHEGREIKLCCNGCVKPFKKNPDEFIAKIDEAIIKQQLSYYPMDTCVVMGEPLEPSEMGDPVNIVYKNRLVRFCCKGCVRKFNKGPGEYLEKIDQAVVAQQMADYPLSTCVVMEDEALGEEAVNHVFANRLVRFCCKGCVRKFKKDPLAYVAKIDAARN